MNATYTKDPCADHKCLVPPAEFVRLRYFFGQRLGVIDLADEQSYLIGKQRFHNLRLHGAGVLCGLRAERFVFPQGSPPETPTTLLRIRRGAALDYCGREIIVGWDQCIDVAAWYAQNLAVNGGGADDNLQLWVALRYRECPSDLAPAPRDPCGCDAGGCEFARIREGFELTLLTGAQAEACHVPDEPYTGIEDEEQLAETSEAAYQRATTRIGGADCSDAPPADACLLLANFQVTLSDNKVVDITAPDNEIPERRTLLPTAVLQKKLVALLSAAGDAGLSSSGPHYSTVRFVNGGANSGTLSIELTAPLARDPFAAPGQVTTTVYRFKDDGDWEAVPGFTSTYIGGPPPRIDLVLPAGLVDGGRYRAVLTIDQVRPSVDSQMRPLTPPVWARHFRLIAEGGILVLAQSLNP